MIPVLVLVDLQADYLQSPSLEPGAETLIERASRLLAGCRAYKIPVVHVWTTVSRENDKRLPHWKKSGRWICVDGTEGHQPPESLGPANAEIVIHKTGFNGFANPDLDAALRRLGCDTIIIAGLHLHTCVRAIAVEALERGFGVIIASDAVASNDPIYAAATERWLAARCVEFAPGGAVLASLEGYPTSPLIHCSPRQLDEILFEIPESTAADVSHAVTGARHAKENWHHVTMDGRAKILESLAARVETAAPDLARQMAIDLGKPISHGFEEVRRAAQNIRDVIRRASAPFHIREPGGLTRRQPLGVVGLISPWNNPVAIPLGKIAPALMYGNTVVWKPAPAAMRVSQAILTIIQDSGVPPGAVAWLSGGPAAARQIAEADGVDAMTVTGSARAGRTFQEICARRMIPLQAELNGNNAAIVWDDADQKRAAEEVARGAFGFAGQRCTANRRVIVPRTMLDEFVERLKLAANRLVWGDPLEEATDIGPVISREKVEEHATLINRAQKGRTPQRVEFPLGRQPADPRASAGAYAPPAIAVCNQPGNELVQHETMSPLLIVQPAGDFDEALALCNGVPQGLAAALFAESPKLRARFLEGARAGILKLDSATAGVDVRLPFGGWKSSGVGPPEHGPGDIEFYTRAQAVYGLRDNEQS